MKKGRARRTALLLGGLVLCPGASSVSAQVPTFDSAEERASFLAMAEYLARDGGRWRSPNPNHDGSVGSPPEFGLWFTRRLDGRVLEIQIVVYFTDRTMVSAHGQWTWHPGRGEVLYITTDRGGGVTEGVTSFPDSVTFRTLSTRFGRAGPATELRDENVLVSDTVHRNETFGKTDGEWVSGGRYEWRRESG